ncbi:MAG: hydroxyacylglutathione hydrolase [Alphaproteobacteria bacterium]|nr:hydroxyacylglutathione hydrolase [Alphaproteobacteria bacterium]MBT4083428.1 hydroxyacylglutathione hydrolase [Alphaproteobacteria bacterium]MBT4542920.1 hydroxyacylglutathione hydrolase [Alphaproteobacteria bacterium]MBT5920294.1 hydroxyacylglutathione hydrolase [Alphaproteobacteria bacterium]MBT6384651.1 hydroxyacylglutathione hydrolase [Alphaproteobacteria bacterium]
MAHIDVVQIPVLSDNYVYLARDEESGTCGVVDPAVGGPVIAELEKRGWTLDWIINTHHHGDHTGANLELKEKYGCQIVGPRLEQQRIPGIDQAVGDGDTFSLGNSVAKVYDVPGHTAGHNAYWFEDSDTLFCGDTLFALGCGRVFEGTHEQMWTSLDKLRGLPAATKIYCAHEYTEANLNFALSVEPANSTLVSRGNQIRALRAEGKPTVPSTMGDELATNPFVRADQEALQIAVGMPGSDPVSVFAEVRTRKDNF